MGPRTGIDAVAERNNLCPCPKSNPDSPACGLVTILTELLGFHSILNGFRLQILIHTK